MQEGAILITGGAGYIGSHTVRLLTSQRRKIVVLDNLVYGHRDAIIDDQVEFVKGEVGDKELLKELFSRHMPVSASTYSLDNDHGASHIGFQ